MSSFAPYLKDCHTLSSAYHWTFNLTVSQSAQSETVVLYLSVVLSFIDHQCLLISFYVLSVHSSREQRTSLGWWIGFKVSVNNLWPWTLTGLNRSDTWVSSILGTAYSCLKGFSYLSYFEGQRGPHFCVFCKSVQIYPNAESGEGKCVTFLCIYFSVETVMKYVPRDRTSCNHSPTLDKPWRRTHNKKDM